MDKTYVYYLGILMLFIIIVSTNMVSATIYSENYNDSIGKFNGTLITTFEIVDTNDKPHEINGETTYIFTEQGWDIKLHGKLIGSCNKNIIDLLSTTPVKYGGDNYSINMHIQANYDNVTDSYTGTKTGYLTKNNIPYTDPVEKPFNAIKSL